MTALRLAFTSALCAVLSASLPSAASAAPDTRCSAPTAPLFPEGAKVLRTVRVITGKDGESHFEDSVQTGETHPFFNTDKVVALNVLSKAAKVSLVSGPANETIPMQPKPPSVYLVLAGWTAVTTASGEERVIRPGTLLIFDDGASKSGHGGRTGPCGYVSLGLTVPVAPATPPTKP